MKKNARVLPMILALMVSCGSVWAAQADTMEISPFLSGLFGGAYEGFVDGYGFGDISQDDATFAGLRLSYFSSPYWGMEVTFGAADTAFIFEEDGFLGHEGEPITDVDLYRIHGAFVFPFGRGQVFPFIDTGAGITIYDMQDKGYQTKVRFTASVGTGIRFHFNEHVGLRFDARGYFSFVDADSWDEDRWDDHDEQEWEVLPDFEVGAGLIFM